MAALLRLVNEGIRSVSTARQVSISRLSLLSLNNISRFNSNQTNSNRMIFFERPLSYFSDSDAEKAKPFDAHLFSRYGDYVLDSARFAVNFHNQKQNAQLQFVRVLKADRLRVAEAGSLLYITLEVNDAATGKSSFYRTRVHYWPWEKKRQVDAWEHVETPSFDLEDKYEDTDDDESYPTKIKSPFSYFSDTEADESYPMEVDDDYYESFVLDSARFAVNFHNHKQNAQLQFVRVIKANTLLVGGLLLYILLEVNDAGKLDFYRTRIYYRPWEEKRCIDAWEHVEITSSDLEEDEDENNSCYEKYVLKGVPFDLDSHNRKQASKFPKRTAQRCREIKLLSYQIKRQAEKITNMENFDNPRNVEFEDVEKQRKEEEEEVERKAKLDEIAERQRVLEQRERLWKWRESMDLGVVASAAGAAVSSYEKYVPMLGGGARNLRGSQVTLSLLELSAGGLGASTRRVFY